MDEYDVGLLNDWGGGNVAWWHDYLRYEIGRANSHWIQQTESLRAELAECRSKPQELHLHANGDSIDCRTCDRYTVFHSGYLCGLTKSVAVIVCIKGDAYIPADPVRLYETGGE